MRFPWGLLIFALVALVSGLVAFDVYANKGYHKSKTYRILQESGLLVLAEQAWQRIHVYAGKAWVWIQVNVPLYYARVCEVCGPYLTIFWEKLYNLGIYIAEATKPQREWVNRKVPEFLEWLQEKMPGYWESVSHYLSIAWDLMVQYSLWLWHHCVYVYQVTALWLTENVFTGSWSIDNLHKSLVSCLVTVQNYTTTAIQWCADTWHGKTS